MKITGAKAVVECLLEQGVDTVFGYPGGMILPLYDAMQGVKNLKHILTVHEQEYKSFGTFGYTPPAFNQNCAPYSPFEVLVGVFVYFTQDLFRI